MKQIKKLLIGLAVFTALLWWNTGKAEAAITYGNGYYTNLCDSGTKASYYSCNSGCDPQSGSCKSDNMGVVKWICSGKWNQCLESESQWGNYEQVDNVSCGYTVQLSLFDKKCRRIDGTWDNTCNLLGYMVWYSGECWSGTPAPTIGVIRTTPVPTSSVTSTPKPSIVPTAVAVSKLTNTLMSGASPVPTLKPTATPTSVPIGGFCGVKCKQAVDCRVGFACMDGVCRNPSCSTDKSCFCQTSVAATASAVIKNTPNTGVETWLGMGGMVALGAMGIKLRKMARKVW